MQGKGEEREGKGGKVRGKGGKVRGKGGQGEGGQGEGGQGKAVGRAERQNIDMETHVPQAPYVALLLYAYTLYI